MEAGRCRACGTRFSVPSGGQILLPASNPLQNRAFNVSPEAIAELLVFPGMSEDDATRLASKGQSLEDVFALALPPWAVREGLHRALAQTASAPMLLEEAPLRLPHLTACGVCGGAVREEDVACAICGTRVFLGESVAAIERTLEAAGTDVPSLEDDMDYMGLPQEFRHEIRTLLGTGMTPEPTPSRKTIVTVPPEPEKTPATTESRMTALEQMGQRLTRLFKELRNGDGQRNA